MRTRAWIIAALAAASMLGVSAHAQPALQSPDYGAPISVEQAKEAAAAAQAEARRNGWRMAVAVVDPGGYLVYFERSDGTQNASVQLAQAKARTSALFRRPSKVFADQFAAGMHAGHDTWPFGGQGQSRERTPLHGVEPAEGGQATHGCSGQGLAVGQGNGDLFWGSGHGRLLRF